MSDGYAEWASRQARERAAANANASAEEDRIRADERDKMAREEFRELTQFGMQRRLMIRGRDYTIKTLRIAAARDGRADVIEWLEDQTLPTFGEAEKKKDKP
jgi:hypothetical protein